MVKGGMKKMVWYNKTALVLANIGAINWGLAELNFNIVDLALGSIPVAATVVYYVIALCGIYALYKVFK